MFIVDWSDDMFKTGMVIKVFPDTNVGIYTDWIRQEGYNFRVYRDRIEVIGRTYKLVDKVEMGMIIRNARLKKKFSKELMAIRIGVTPKTVGDWERGAKKPSLNSLSKYCKIVGLDKDKVIEDATR